MEKREALHGVYVPVSLKPAAEIVSGEVAGQSHSAGLVFASVASTCGPLSSPLPICSNWGSPVNSMATKGVTNVISG